MTASFPSATERTKACLARIAELDPGLGAFITVTADMALQQARAADMATARGETLGPLHGMPIAIKDCIDVAAIRCTHGSSFFTDRIAHSDAVVVERLRRVGAVIVGKANMHEFAFGGTTQNAFHGACRNPWDTSRIPGGSSGGSAVAIASGLAWGALGTDTGSSIRMPAALTGVTGFRPTGGSVPSNGVLPVSPPHDIVGPLAASVADVARIQSAITDDRRFDAALDGSLSGVRIAIPEDFFFAEAEPDIAELVLTAARRLEAQGASLVTRSIPGAADAQSHLTSVLFADVADFHRERIETQPGGFSAGVRQRLRPGLDMRAIDYAHAMRWLEQWRARCAAFFADDADVMITPTVPIAAPTIGDDAALAAVTSRLSRFCWAWSAARVPALTVPCGFSAGLPVGMQIAAARWKDAQVLNIGHRYQQATDWHLRKPPLAKPRRSPAERPG